MTSHFKAKFIHFYLVINRQKFTLNYITVLISAKLRIYRINAQI